MSKKAAAKTTFGFQKNQEAELELGKDSQFPGMGFNHRDGEWFINGEAYEGTVHLYILAMRRCKETQGFADDTLYRYPLRTKKSDMINGFKPTKQKGKREPGSKERMQILVRIPALEEEGSEPAIFAFGSSAFTGIKSFTNPRSGSFRLDGIPTGIWYQLEDWVSTVLKEYGEEVPYYCWQLPLAVGDQIVVNEELGTKAYPIILEEEPNPDWFNGEIGKENEDFIIDNHIQEWVDDWQKGFSSEALVPSEIDEADWEEEPDDEEEPDEETAETAVAAPIKKKATRKAKKL